MHARKIQVKNGRLVLDEATNLPDGAEVEILVIDDELTIEERADLHAFAQSRRKIPTPAEGWRRGIACKGIESSVEIWFLASPVDSARIGEVFTPCQRAGALPMTPSGSFSDAFANASCTGRIM